MTNRLDPPLELQQIGVDAAEPGSVTPLDQPATRRAVWRGGDDDL